MKMIISAIATEISLSRCCNPLLSSSKASLALQVLQKMVSFSITQSKPWNMYNILWYAWLIYMAWVTDLAPLHLYSGVFWFNYVSFAISNKSHDKLLELIGNATEYWTEGTKLNQKDFFVSYGREMRRIECLLQPSWYFHLWLSTVVEMCVQYPPPLTKNNKLIVALNTCCCTYTQIEYIGMHLISKDTDMQMPLLNCYAYHTACAQYFIQYF